MTSFFSYKLGEKHTTDHYERIIVTDKKNYLEELNKNTIHILDQERQLNKLTEQLNDQDYIHKQEVNNLTTTISTMRLRDRNKTITDTTTNTTSTNTTDSEANRTEESQLLSEPLTRLLQRITSEADIINIAYNSCRKQLDIDRSNDNR